MCPLLWAVFLVASGVFFIIAEVQKGGGGKKGEDEDTAALMGLVMAGGATGPMGGKGGRV